MRIAVINPNATASMTETIAAAARRACGRRGPRSSRAPTRTVPPRSRGMSTARSPCPASSTASRRWNARASTPMSSPASTTPASTPRGRSPGARHRHRRGRRACREPPGAPVRGRDDACLLRADPRGQPRGATASPRSAAASGERDSGAGARSRSGGRATAAFPRRSTERSTRTVPRRSCSAAPAWPTSPTELAERHGLPVIEGVAAAVKLAEALAALGLKTSKRGGYAPPRPKPGGLGWRAPAGGAAF